MLLVHQPLDPRGRWCSYGCQKRSLTASHVNCEFIPGGGRIAQIPTHEETVNIDYMSEDYVSGHKG